MDPLHKEWGDTLRVNRVPRPSNAQISVSSSCAAAAAAESEGLHAPLQGLRLIISPVKQGVWRGEESQTCAEAFNLNSLGGIQREAWAEQEK